MTYRNVSKIWLRGLKLSGGGFDFAGKTAELQDLEQRSAAPKLWHQPDKARVLMQQLAALQETVTYWTNLRQDIQDTLELAELEDDDFAADLEIEAARLTAKLDHAEFQLLFSGPHDRDNAILALHAGAGGTDSQDWAAMLLRMFLRWAEQHKFKTNIYDSMPGEGAGIKSTTVGIRGSFVYGYLRAERGVHRLVRLSPFDSAHRRHTSFVLVEVWPDLQADTHVEINPDDLAVDTFRASSAGGQHMQKNDTAVRITHTPTGIIVACQNERSQMQNRETALRILKARLVQLKEDQHRAELERLKGEHVEAGWGNQIRSYVLHPYQMVKDHRTGRETGNVPAVLDGDLDAFMEAFLHHSLR